MPVVDGVAVPDLTSLVKDIANKFPNDFNNPKNLNFVKRVAIEANKVDSNIGLSLRSPGDIRTGTLFYLCPNDGVIEIDIIGGEGGLNPVPMWMIDKVILPQGPLVLWGSPVANNKPPVDDKKPEPIVVIKEVIKEVVRPRVKYEEMMNFVARVNKIFKETKLGKQMNALPEHTQAHILWRYFFEHNTYSDDKLIEEVRFRGNETWVD